MNGREFYDIITRKFPGVKSVSHYVNPLWNWREKFTDVQFIYPNGSLAGPWYSEAGCFFVAEPLAGPFYDLAVLGISMGPIALGGTAISSVVQLPDGELVASGSFVIPETVSVAYETLKEVWHDKWYSNDASGLLIEVEKPDGLVQENQSPGAGEETCRL